MNVFLDTNVVMDFLAARGDTTNVRKIFRALDEGLFCAYISVGSFYTITYLLELFLKGKGISNPERLHMQRDVLESILARMEISIHSKTDLLVGTLDISSPPYLSSPNKSPAIFPISHTRLSPREAFSFYIALSFRLFFSFS